MTNLRKSKLSRALLAASATPLFLAALPSQAQDQSVSRLEEVVVTARKRSESLQDVPVAVSALTPTQIEQSGIQSMVDVGKLVPKVELHLHLEGAIPIPALWDLVEKYGGDPAVLDQAALQRFLAFRIGNCG